MNGPVGIVCGSWPPIKCGVGDFTQRLAMELGRLGSDILVITDRRAALEPLPGVRVLPLVDSWSPVALPSVLDALQRAGVSLVNIQYPTQEYGRLSLIDLLPAAARLSLKRPVITTIHEYKTFQRLGRLRVRNLVRTSTAAIVPDPANREAIAADLPQAAVRVHGVPLAPVVEPNPGLDREAWRAARRLTPDTLALAYFGFLSPGKGVEVLLDAVERLPSNLDFRVWLLADREPAHPRYAGYHLEIARQLAEMQNRERVTWTGYLPPSELSAYLSSSDLAVLPYADGAALRRTTMLTALRHGLPVLSTGKQPPCGGVRVVPAGDAEALARAILQLAQDRQSLASLAADAERVGASVNWRTIAEQTAAVYSRYAER
ncbi:MAG: glycosyltransferase [Rudaea sp.]